MITESGENLDIIIETDESDDWRTFQSWYSVFKNLPDANITVVCNRNKRIEFQYFQWLRRLKINHFYQNMPENRFFTSLNMSRSRKFSENDALIIRCGTMVTSLLDDSLLKLMSNEKCILNEDVAYVKKDFSTETPNTTPIAFEAKDTENGQCLITFNKGCGRWINSMRGCPFSSANAFVTNNLTVNELRIINLWKQMPPLYSVVL